MPAYIKTETHITVVFDSGKNGTMFSSDPSFEQLCTSLKQTRWDDVYDLMFPVEPMKRVISSLSNNRVTINAGIVTLDGTPMHNTLTDRMLDMHADGFDIAPLSNFLENLMDNPSYRAVNELYGFLEKSKLPITDDGQFYAYKRVDSEFKDMYTHKMDNSIGQIVSMPRNEVNEDKEQTCSTGLHFCAREYLSSYGTFSGPRVVIVKINPRDVVSIPSDYNDAKGRCCRYEVVRELDIDEDTAGRLPTEKIEGSFMKTEPMVSDEEVNDLIDVTTSLLDEMTADDWETSVDSLNDVTITTSFNELLAGVQDMLDDETNKTLQDNVNKLIGNNTLLDDEPLTKIKKEADKVKSTSKKVQKLSPIMGNDARVILAVYNSPSEAMKDTGVNSSSITKVCNGKRQSAGGYGWAWLPEVKMNDVRGSIRDFYDGIDVDDASREED